MIRPPPRVKAQIKINITPAIAEDSSGERNQEATVNPNLPQLISEAESPAKPAPTSAPITVCVPLIGIPKIELTKMKLKALRHVPSIMIC